MSATGSIRPKHSGWEVRVSAGFAPDGTRRRISRYVTGTRKEAEQALLRLRLEVGDGTAGRGDATTVAELLATWLPIVAGRLEANTVDGYRYVAREYLIPHLGRISLRKLDAARIDHFYRDVAPAGVRGRPLSATSIRQIHATLRSALTQAVKWGWIERNPAMLATPPRAVRREVRPPAVDDAITIMAAARARDDDLADWLHVAVMTGARRGELAGVQWDDLDLEVGVLTIRRAIVDVRGQVTEKDPKSHQVRRLALDAATVELLRARRARCGERALMFGKGLGPWVWGADPSHHDPVRPDTITGKYRRLTAHLGIRTRLHDLRHLNVTLGLAAGTDPATVAARAGHGSTKMTLDVYGHALPDRQQLAADAVAAAFRR